MSLFKRPNMRGRTLLGVGLLLVLVSAFGSIHVYAQATQGMVAAAHPLAAEAGLEMLQRGGNAVDAAVAAAFAIGVVEPHASGLGGGGYMTIYLADRNEAIVIDYQTEAPMSARPDMLVWDNPSAAELDARRRQGAGAALIPGTVAGLITALEQYGTLSLAEVLEPSIRLAENGFPVSRTLYEAMLDNWEPLVADEESARVWLHQGFPYFEGETLRLPDLARTLRRIAEEGRDGFYRGPVGQAIVELMEQQGGYITLEDLASYEPIVQPALHSTYKDLDLYGVPPSGSGSLVLAQALNVLEHYNLRESGHNTPLTILRMGEALRIGYYDRLRWVADPKFVDIPIPGLVSKEYAAEAVKLLNDMRRGHFDRNSLPNPYDYHVAPNGPSGDVAGSGSTTHLSTVDSQGNMVALTQTIVHFFGSKTTVPGTGVLLNNAMTSFFQNPGTLNSIEAGKRPRSYMAPTVILRGGKPFMSVGSPGSDRIPSAILQVLMNIIEFDMDLEEALRAPRFHTTTGSTLDVEARFDEQTLLGLQLRGYSINTREPFDLYFGGVQLILIDQETGQFYGAADPRRDGAVVGF